MVISMGICRNPSDSSSLKKAVGRVWGGVRGVWGVWGEEGEGEDEEDKEVKVENKFSSHTS